MAAHTSPRTVGRIKSRFSLWLTCGLVLGILPVILDFMAPVFTNGSFSLTAPLADGQLLISSTAIAGAAIAELFQTNISDDELKLAAIRAGGLTIIFCICCAVAYALVRSSNNPSPEAASMPISPVIGSVFLFVITMFVAGRCVRVAAEASGV